MLIAAALALASPQAAAIQIADGCRIAVTMADLGDYGWLERRMSALHFPEKRKAQERAFCMMYLQGRRDEARSREQAARNQSQEYHR